MHHILVVDDDEEITALLTQYLTRFGYATYSACDGDSMRTQLAAQPIDLVVLDVMLPGVDGIRLAKELRSHSQLPMALLHKSGLRRGPPNPSRGYATAAV